MQFSRKMVFLKNQIKCESSFSADWPYNLFWRTLVVSNTLKVSVVIFIYDMRRGILLIQLVVSGEEVSCSHCPYHRCKQCLLLDFGRRISNHPKSWLDGNVVCIKAEESRSDSFTNACHMSIITQVFRIFSNGQISKNLLKLRKRDHTREPSRRKGTMWYINNHFTCSQLWAQTPHPHTHHPPQLPSSLLPLSFSLWSSHAGVGTHIEIGLIYK